MKQNGAVYYYITNLQGDVVRLVNSSGSTAAYYKYDPYGNAITASGSHATINPLRYRGYYYDTETGLYYCQSRYYDPTIGRFINADAFASTGQGIIGHNMFAYCGNNPVNNVDYAGNMFAKVAREVFDEWLNGDGTDKSYEEDDLLSKKVKKNKKFKEIKEAALEDYLNGVPESEWSKGSVYLGVKDSLDLFLAVRRCNYTIQIIEEKRTTGV